MRFVWKPGEVLPSQRQHEERAPGCVRYVVHRGTHPNVGDVRWQIDSTNHRDFTAAENASTIDSHFSNHANPLTKSPQPPVQLSGIDQRRTNLKLIAGLLAGLINRQRRLQ